MIFISAEGTIKLELGIYGVKKSFKIFSYLFGRPANTKKSLSSKKLLANNLIWTDICADLVKKIWKGEMQSERERDQGIIFV